MDPERLIMRLGKSATIIPTPTIWRNTATASARNDLFCFMDITLLYLRTRHRGLCKMHTETGPVTKRRYQPRMPKEKDSQRDLETNNHPEEEGSQRRDTWLFSLQKEIFTAFAYFTRILSLRQCP
jgi:hypothetical protein